MKKPSGKSYKMPENVIRLISFASGELKECLRRPYGNMKVNGIDMLVYTKADIKEKLELINELFLNIT